LRYAELAESIKEQVLKTSIDIFVNPDNYKYSDENIAEVATNAQEFYKEKK
jgi:flagellar biosynthesis/type III secretory pathway protein FliH